MRKNSGPHMTSGVISPSGGLKSWPMDLRKIERQHTDHVGEGKAHEDVWALRTDRIWSRRT